jgi:hypothetical protein
MQRERGREREGEREKREMKRSNERRSLLGAEQERCDADDIGKGVPDKWPKNADERKFANEKAPISLPT